jgi:stage II sporulation protein D
MNNKKRTKGITVLCLVIVVAIIASAVGCRQGQRRPAPSEQLTKAEPEISVYINQKKETRKMKMEDYIAGVVAAEMKTDWPVEALAAQAILARTYTMEAIERKGGVPERGTQASTSVEEFQAWDETKINDNVRAAVKMTRGEVVVYQGDYINSWFHAYSGGKTATAKEGLDYTKTPTPFIHIVDDPGENYAPAENKNWTATFTKEEVKNAALKMGIEVGNFSRIKIGERGPSGRVTTLLIGDKQVSAPGFRVNIGSTKLKSTLISDLSVSGNKVTFKGTGYGHGVGLSQWGAYALAKAGKSPEEIVKYFFKDVEVVKRWQ